MKKSTIRNHERHLAWEAAKERKIAQEIMTKMVLAETRPMVQAQISKALEGDTKSFDTLMDRTIGPAKTTVEVTGDVKFSLVSLAARWEEQQKKKLEDKSEHPTNE